MSKPTPKYNIKKYATQEMKATIIKELQISETSYYRKVNATTDEKNGFEACEMLVIESIIERPLKELFNPEAVAFYYQKKQNIFNVNN